jgi:hypothetical protein
VKKGSITNNNARRFYLGPEVLLSSLGVSYLAFDTTRISGTIVRLGFRRQSMETRREKTWRCIQTLEYRILFAKVHISMLSNRVAVRSFVFNGLENSNRMFLYENTNNLHETTVSVVKKCQGRTFIRTAEKLPPACHASKKNDEDFYWPRGGGCTRLSRE